VVVAYNFRAENPAKRIDNRPSIARGDDDAIEVGQHRSPPG
jgi:hypothetical protein